MCDDFTELRELQRKLEDAKNHLEDEVQSRTKQLQEALEVKSRFLAVMSHGKLLFPFLVTIFINGNVLQFW